MTIDTKPATNAFLGEIVQLEAWAQEELAAQEELDRLLEAEEDAIRRSDAAALSAAGAAVAAALRRGAGRERRRLLCLRTLAGRFRVAPASLTLTSIAARASAEGVDTTRLLRARDQLRAAAAGVLKRGRRIASLARYHSGLMNELIRALMGDAAAGVGLTGANEERGGRLVNEEA